MIKNVGDKNEKLLETAEDKNVISNKEQLEATKNQSNTFDKKPRKVVLLKHRLDYIFKTFSLNFNSTGKDFLKKLAKGKEKIEYNFFFKITDPVIEGYNFLENVGTLYDLLINLLSIQDSSVMQLDLTKIINSLKNIISK